MLSVRSNPETQMRSHSVSYWTMTVIWWVVLIVSALVGPFMAWRGIQGRFFAGAGAIVALITWFAIVAAIVRFTRGQQPADCDGGSLSPEKTIWSMVLIGLIVRVAYYYGVFPWPLISDESAYIDLANHINETGTVIFPANDPAFVLRAFRPPGYSFFLLPFVHVFENDRIGAFVANLLLFPPTIWMTYSLAKELAGKHAAMLACALVLVWPNFIFTSAAAFTEPLSVFLFLVIIWSTFRFAQRTKWFLWSILAGASLGFAILVKSSLLLFPFVWVIFILISPERRGNLLIRCSVAVFTATMVVAPWTVRNYIVLGDFVPVSTNGGSVMYRSNNPLASGTFKQKGEKDLDALMGDEVNWNRTGFKWALEWIKDNPFRFLELVLHKQKFFLADDYSGAFFTYSRFILEKPNPTLGETLTGSFLQIAGNLWWILLWLLFAASLILRRQFWRTTPLASLMLLPFLYLLAVHSVFESQTRYHMPVVAFICIGASILLSRNRPKRVYESVTAAPGSSKNQEIRPRS